MSSLTLAQSKDFLKELSSPAKVQAKATREAKVSVGDLWDTRGFLEKLDALGFLSSSVEEILGHGDLGVFFDTQKSQKKSQKKASLTDEERLGQYTENLCDARVWKEKPKSGGLGYDNIQCTSKKVDGCECLCKKHFKMQVDGKLWTGLITEPRPEDPVHPTAGPKTWSTDVDGNEVVKEKKVRKKSSEPKKKKEPKEKKSKEYTTDQLMELLAKAKKKDTEKKEEEKEDDGWANDTEELSDGEDEDYEDITVDGVEYQLNKEDKTVIRKDDFSPVGVWNTETGKIDFDEDEDE